MNMEECLAQFHKHIKTVCKMRADGTVTDEIETALEDCIYRKETALKDPGAWVTGLDSFEYMLNDLNNLIKEAMK